VRELVRSLEDDVRSLDDDERAASAFLWLGGAGIFTWFAVAALPLAGLLSSTDLAEAFPRMLENGVMPLKLANTLISLSEPWDEAFSDSYLAALRRMVGKAFSTGSGVSYWPDTLETAAERFLNLERFTPPHAFGSSHWQTTSLLGDSSSGTLNFTTSFLATLADTYCTSWGVAACSGHELTRWPAPGCTW
jgi:hypothetical protein